MRRRSAALAIGRLVRVLPVVVLAAGVAAVPAAAGAVGAAAAPGSGHRAAAPSTFRGTWRLLPSAPVTSLPASWAVSHAWTGRHLIVHYALLGSSQAGSRAVTFSFTPAGNAWAKLPAGPKPVPAQGDDAAAWTGSRMLVYGLTGGAYSPASNTWQRIARPGRPPSQISGWTGSRLVVWDEICCGMTVNTAEVYNPAADAWHTSTSPLDKRSGAMGAWTGKELVIFGGFSGFPAGGRVFRDGAAYNPATDTWRRLPPMPQRRGGGTAVWDGREVLFLGGTGPGTSQPSLRGMAFNPATNNWRLLPVMQYRRARLRGGVDRSGRPGVGRAVRASGRVGRPAARRGVQPGGQPVECAAEVTVAGP